MIFNVECDYGYNSFLLLINIKGFSNKKKKNAKFQLGNTIKVKIKIEKFVT